ncbi:MAG: DUF1996 domain-containing protein, partial [Actinomycetota bacterium]
MRRAGWAVSVLVVIVTAAPIAGGAGILPLFGPSPSNGNFAVSCPYSHRLPDDPIVFPNKPGASHSHDFFGNVSTNAYSNFETLRAAESTCNREADRSAYWVPTLLYNGTAVTPSKFSAYYLAFGKDAKTLKPFPSGLRIVAGDSKATAPQTGSAASWSCGFGNDGPPVKEIPTCPAGKPLRMHIAFPDCWDGKHLDWIDHKSHMTYSKNKV